MKEKYPGTFKEECGKIGSKFPNFQKEVIEKFCCKTCRVLRVKNAKAPAKKEPSNCEDRRANWCSKLNLKYPNTFERLCGPNWSDKLGCCKTCKDLKVMQTTAETTKETTNEATTVATTTSTRQKAVHTSKYWIWAHSKWVKNP